MNNAHTMHSLNGEVNQSDGPHLASKRPFKVLHLVIGTQEAAMAYMEFVLAKAEQDENSVCTYFESVSTVPDSVKLYEGNRTIRGFFRSLETATLSDEYDVVHAHFPHVALPFLMRFFWNRRWMRKSVMTVHNSYSNFGLRNRLLLLPVFACFRRIVCCSRSSYESYPLVYRLLAGKRLTYIKNGVDTKKVEQVLSQHIRSNHSDFTIATACRLAPIKNLDATIEALQLLDDQAASLIIIGDGPERLRLESMCGKLGLERRVEFTGFVDRDVVYRYLFDSDVFVSTSFGEGLPIAVLEAMACGCPVVLSDIPPHREIAEKADFIPLLAPDDAAGFAREIKRLRDMNAADRLSVGRQCQELVRRNFSLDSMHRSYENIYSQIRDIPDTR